jgi:hypothetical protein
MNKQEMQSQGVIFIHSSPAVLLRHVEWAIRRALSYSVAIQWTQQPVQPNTFRSEIFWSGAIGTGATVASELLGWGSLRFEVTEDANGTNEGSRWCFAPSLGLFHSHTDALGNLQLSEFVVKKAISDAGNDPKTLLTQLGKALGTPWDNELEPFRATGMSAPSVWVNRVG